MELVKTGVYDNAENAEFPHWVIPGLAQTGIVGADMPSYLGGKELNTVDVGHAMYNISRVDAGVATFLVVHNSLAQYTVFKCAQEELKKRVMADTMTCKKVLCWALTEPENGSDASGLTTTATKVEGGYLINGKKRWIGNGTFADYICCWARNTNVKGNPIQCFLIHGGSKGVTASKIQRKMSLRNVQNADFIFENVFVPDQDHMELAKDFASGTREVLLHSRIYVAWLAVGIAAGAVDAAMDYCKKRVQFRKPLAKFQMVQS